jgi:hypothetical protein
LVAGIRPMRVRIASVVLLLLLGGWSIAMGISPSSAQALTYGGSSWVTCSNNAQAAEVYARYMPLEPANNATVQAGTPVTFSGESKYPLTFNVASSEALLASPDIEAGLGTQSGAFYKLTSTKAASAPRTVHWTASFTTTPTGCEAPSTFTTPVQTLTVTPSEAELAAAKRQQEEAAAKRQQEEAAAKDQQEEVAAKKKQEEAAAAGSVVLDAATIMVRSGRDGVVKLLCSDVQTCAGELALTVRTTGGRGHQRHAESETIGVGSFAIAPGAAAMVEIRLNKVGAVLLRFAHGHLDVNLTVHRTAPLPDETQAEAVHLDAQKPTSGKR